MSFRDRVETCYNDNPDPFETYDPRGIAEALFKRGDLDPQNVKLELAEAYVRTHRRQFDPNWEDAHAAGPSAPTPRTPKAGDLEEAFMIGVIRANRVMGDGRYLREWTFGELREEHAGWVAFLKRFEHIADDELVGNHLK